jgi:SAM-dependent methyltransferase
MNLVDKVRLLIYTEGISGLVWRIKRLLLPNKFDIYENYKGVFKGKSAIEIGGPSKIFNSDDLLPVYSQLEQVDGCNFSNNTVWEGQMKAGLDNYVYDSIKKGSQYINEGSDLSTIPSGHYDVLLSCHSLEHIANPLKALKEWNRVLKTNGHILLILPHPKYTFDHNRQITKFEHLLKDFNDNIDESDLSCVDEVTEFHDLKRDMVGPKTKEELRKRSINNIENRCLHHHVFDFDLISKMLEYTGFELLDNEFIKPFHMVGIGKKRA